MSNKLGRGEHSNWNDQERKNQFESNFPRTRVTSGHERLGYQETAGNIQENGEYIKVMMLSLLQLGKLIAPNNKELIYTNL